MMADFNIAFELTSKFEGGYVDDPTDMGGETYKGIARKYNHKWPGWAIIDSLKGNNFPKILDTNEELQKLVKSLYKEKYWDVFYGNLIPDQSIANELYDCNVNMGNRSIQFLQIGLNILNREGKLYLDVPADAKFGKETFDALTTYLKTESATWLLSVMVLLRGNHYINIVRNNPTQEKFIRGWLSRIQLK